VDSVRVEGPRGEFVLNEESHRALVFIAGESGFAPIKSLIEHAMALDAAESIHLVWVAADSNGHYLDNLCRSWSDALDDFRYTPLTAGGDVPDESVLRPVLQDHPRLVECDVYIAGPARWAGAAEFQLLDHGLPRAQLRVSALQA
jgi:CDP-4-dehydro-6-deoxyglucose reductase